MQTNLIYEQSSVWMPDVDTESVHLVVTSPPYNVDIAYDTHDDTLSLDEHLELMSSVFKECYRVLVDGGRLCVNIGNTGRKPYIPLTAHLTIRLLDIGYHPRGEIIWDKGAGALSTAWGSWASPSNPTLRDQHEYILCMCKGDYKRKQPGGAATPGDNWAELTRSIWRFNPEHAKKIGHPAPYPVELAKRCINFYTYQNEIVLDPFMGSGSTAVAAKQTQRRYIGYEISAAYIEIANQRLQQEYLLTQ